MTVRWAAPLAAAALLLAGCSDGVRQQLPAGGEGEHGWVVRQFGERYGNHPPALVHAAVAGDVAIVGGFGAASATASTGYLWRSDDGGASWTSVLPGGGIAGVDAVVRRGTGFVALARLGAEIVDPHPAVLLTSADGRSWESRPVTGIDGTAAALAADGDALVAVGTGGGGAAVWRSADGVTWRRVPGPARGGSFDAVAVVGGRVFAVGADGPEPFLGEIGADSWRVVAGPAGLPDRTATRALAVVRSQLVLVVATCGDDGRCRLAGWSSSDGAVWHDFPLPEADAAAVLLAGSGPVTRLVAAGSLHVARGGSWDTFDVPLDAADSLVRFADRTCLIGMMPAEDDPALQRPSAACARTAADA